MYRMVLRAQPWAIVVLFFYLIVLKFSFYNPTGNLDMLTCLCDTVILVHYDECACLVVNANCSFWRGEELLVVGRGVGVKLTFLMPYKQFLVDYSWFEWLLLCACVCVCNHAPTMILLHFTLLSTEKWSISSCRLSISVFHLGSSFWNTILITKPLLMQMKIFWHAWRTYLCRYLRCLSEFRFLCQIPY